MSIDVAAYENQPDEQLAKIAASNYDLTQAVLSAHPEIAQDAGFELFDAGWARRYWRKILAEVSGENGADKIYDWAMGASIAGIADLLVQHYQLPALTLPAAVALAIILIRAAKASTA